MGEFGLIDRLTKGYEKKNESTVYGVGDDCAVMHYPDKEVLITTDMLWCTLLLIGTPARPGSRP